MTYLRTRQLVLGLMLTASAVGIAHAATATRTAAFEYDAATGRMTKQIIEPDITQLRIETAYTYDAWGNQISATTSSPATGLAAFAARSSSVSYDTRGQFIVARTNALGQTENSVSEPAFGGMTSLTGPNQLSTQWQYDSFGRKSLETRADGTKTKVDYVFCNGVNGGTVSCPAYAQYVVQSTPLDAGGNVNGPWTKTYYDMLERPVRIETLGFDGVSVIAQTTIYDNLGRIYQVSTPYYSNQTPRWTTDIYDNLNRIVSETRQDGSVTTTAYNGLTTVATNALNQTRTLLKNSQGQLVKVTDAQNNSLTYQYDPLGNLIKTTDPQGNVVTLLYDIRSRKIQMIDPDMGTWNYVYNAAGDLVQQTDAKNQVTNMAYDKLSRMTSRAEADLVSTWTYDACIKGIGKECGATTDNGYSRAQSYDSYGRNTSTASTIDTNYTTSVTYDTNGRIATQVYPTGFAVKYIYTSLGYLKEVRDNASNALYWQANTKDAEGHLLQQTYGNNIVTQKVYDSSTGRLKNIYAGAGNSVQNLSYGFDSIGNMLSRSDANQNLSETFLYDNLRRLTSATVNSNGAGVVTTTYAYDTLGNITSRSDLGTYTYNPSGLSSTRPHAVAQVQLAGGGTQQYSYDANGNLSGQVVRNSSGVIDNTKGRTEVYTSFNMPQALGAPGMSQAFAYGPEHQRVKQIGMSGTTIYLNPDNAGGLLYEKNLLANGGIVHTNYVTAGDQVVAMVKQTNGVNTVNYLHNDHLGSVTAVTDASGAVLERFAYEPFGKRRFPSGTTDPNNTIQGVTTTRGFTEDEHLDALGLIHMNGRIYDPQLGRFMSADASVPHPMDTQSFNRYSYTRNNPLVYVDPDGFYDDYCGDCGGDFGGTGYADTPSSGSYFGGSSNNSYNSTATQTYTSLGGGGTPNSSYFGGGNYGGGQSGTQVVNGNSSDLVSYIPVVGNVVDFRTAVGEGRFGMAAMYGSLAVLDGATLGVDSLIEIPVKATAKSVGEYVTAQAVSKSEATFAQWLSKGKDGYKVYVSDTLDYIGITSRELATRLSEHNAIVGRQFDRLDNLINDGINLTKNQARSIEQALIVRAREAEQAIQNSINSISPKRTEIYNSAVKWGENFLQEHNIDLFK